RTVNVSDNLFNTQHTERTHWNPAGMPGPTVHWLLDTYDFKEQQEGLSLTRQETSFDGLTGFLYCQRRLQNGGAPGAADVIVTSTPDAAGQVASQQWFGGDTQSLSPSASCQSLS